MDASTIITIIGAGGGGAALLALINGLFGLASGAHKRQNQRNLSLMGQRDEALRRELEAHQDETEVRRELAHAYTGLNIFREHAGHVRADCLAHGTLPGTLPEWPRWKPYTSLSDQEKSTIPKE